MVFTISHRNRLLSIEKSEALTETLRLSREKALAKNTDLLLERKLEESVQIRFSEYDTLLPTTGDPRRES